MLPYAITIFLSAFLLFLVQPLIAKYILPWFGGGPGVWTTCLLFFQTALLAGYAYAHASVKWLGPRGQAIAHLALLIGAFLFLPIVPDETWRSFEGGDPSWRILVLLLACIGAPYLALSATGPLMQAWFARTHPGRSPYRLYALSNLGSLLALLAYPLLVEPRLTRLSQANGWSWGFAVYALAAIVCALDLWRRARPMEAATAEASGQRESGGAPRQPTIARVTLWVLLPACASILLMAFTTRLTEEVAPMPLLWIVPLAVYLLSFIVCFEWPRFYHRSTFIALLTFSFWIVAAIMIWQSKVWIVWQVAGFMFALFACCVVCHGEAYRLRPPAARLTAFYLAIAAGGALGGAFVALIAPRIFNFQAEFYLALFGTLGLLLACMMMDERSTFHRGGKRVAWMGLIVVALIAACGMAYKASDDLQYTVMRTRNFFGTLRVDDRPGPPDRGNALFLIHGRITHGAQIMSPDFLRLPTTYFSPASGGGRAIQHFPKSGPRRVGVVGLGIGTLATYGRKGDVFRFYEINPAIVELAQDPFAYLASSPADVQIVLGDARMSMEREAPQNYDILVLDAYSGDTVPLHLLTLEAFTIYDRHLAPGGAILAHISNAHLQLHKPLLPIADALNMEVAVVENAAVPGDLQNRSKWVIMTRNQELLNHQEILPVSIRPTPQTTRVDLWTDERVNLLQIMRLPWDKPSQPK
jgi:MFS family permease